MRIERVLTGIKTLGPGSRMVIWTNGCDRDCKGCVSRRLQRSNPRTEVDIETFFNRFDLSYVDGVTISGGEPFLQKEELLHLLTYLKRRGVKDILVYTGFMLAELRDVISKECLKFISVLIDGPYIEELNDNTNNIKGSLNQNIIYFDNSLKEKYQAYIKKERFMQEEQIQSILIGVGIPSKEYIEEFKKRR